MNKKSISEILVRGSIEEYEILPACNEIAAAGHVCILKMDGARQDNSISIIISFPDDPQRAIRMDCEDLLKGFFGVLEKYQSDVVSR